MLVRTQSTSPLEEVVDIIAFEIAYTVKALELCKTSAEVEQVRKTVLGKNSPLSQIQKAISNSFKEDRARLK